MSVFATAATAQQQFLEAGKRHLPRNYESTHISAVADVDGDADLDLVAGNSNEPNRLYLNDGTGVFVDVTTTRLPIATGTTSLAFGDLDGDGDLDLVVGGPNRLFFNDGTGTFTDATAGHLPVGSPPTAAVALGDLDGDGDLDLFMVAVVQSRLYLNNGRGTFTDVSASNLPVLSLWLAQSLALGDLDGDGDLDFVVGGAQPCRVLRNNGAAVFADDTTAFVPALGNHRTLALGDVDGDGDLDLLVGRNNQDALYLNDGSGRFVDMAASNLPTDDSTSLGLADMDRDGDLDVLVGRTDLRCGLWLNDGSGKYVDASSGHILPVTDQTTSLSFGDFDGDGDIDLVCSNGTNFPCLNRLYLNDGSGSFADGTASSFPMQTQLARLAVLGDEDGDGDLDLVVANHIGTTRMYLNTGAGIAADASATILQPIYGTITALVLGDVDRDGDLDLIIGVNGQQSRLFSNSGSGTFTEVTATQMPARSDPTTSLVLGDVDFDGDLDLVVGNNGAQCRLYLNNGSGTFVDATATRMPARTDATTALVLADVDRDGDLDLVIGNNGAQSRLYLNGTFGTFVDATATHMPAMSDPLERLLAGDLDRDGDLDLLAVAQGRIRMYENDNQGRFFDSTTGRFPLDSTRTALALADVDADGDLDLILGLTPGIYLNNGNALFEVANERAPGDGNWVLPPALGDLDRDGDLDLLAVDASQRVRVNQNLLRQLDAPYLLRSGRDYRIDVYARYGPPRLFDVALPYFSFGTASVPVPPLGIIGIDLATAVALPPLLIPQPAGVGSLTIPVPSVPTLAGTAVHVQALLVQYPTQERLTNVITDTIVR